MTLGTLRDLTEISLGDTAELRVYTYDATGMALTAGDITSVNFTIKEPDGTTVNTAGTIESDGAGYLRFSNTTQKGLYVYSAQFLLTSGEKRSRREDFNVIDPMETPPTTQRSMVAEEVWMRIEDCFDSDLGGPNLRDQTLAYFDREKVARFVAEGLVYINGWPPITQFTLTDFTQTLPSTDPAEVGLQEMNLNQIVIIQSTLLAVIRHLMRSYVEQPDNVGANVVWMSRRDYLQRWETIYQLELAYFKELVALFKRQFLNYGHTSILAGWKAGRLGYGNSYRLRNVARGVF